MPFGTFPGLGSILRIDLRGDTRTFATARAFQLGVFESAPTVFEDEFSAPPLTSPSKWLRAVDTQGSFTQLDDIRGGVVRLSTDGVENHSVATSLGAASGPLPGLISDPGVSATRWYLLWIFRVPTAVDNHTQMALKLVPTTGLANAIFFGVDGIFESTTKLMAEENILNATLSDVDIDPGTWHYLESWQLGVANEIIFGFDGETPKTLALTAPFNNSATMQLQAGNGGTAAVRSLDTDHIVLLMENNVVLQTS